MGKGGIKLTIILPYIQTIGMMLYLSIVKRISFFPFSNE